jgi:hypothetical protein
MAGRLADRLTDRLGSTQVFMDVDTIEPGADFAATIVREVASCDVLIALIGPTWSTIADRQGRRRLDDPDDFVVLEIRTALEREIRVIPVLVDDAIMPDRYDLPEGLQGLARRNAIRLDHETFRSDIATLLDAVNLILSTLAQKAVESTVATAGTATEKQKFQWAKRVAGKGTVTIRGGFLVMGGGAILTVLGYLFLINILMALGIPLAVVGIIMQVVADLRNMSEGHS